MRWVTGLPGAILADSKAGPRLSRSLMQIPSLMLPATLNPRPVKSWPRSCTDTRSASFNVNQRHFIHHFYHIFFFSFLFLLFLKILFCYRILLCFSFFSFFFVVVVSWTVFFLLVFIIIPLFSLSVSSPFWPVFVTPAPDIEHRLYNSVAVLFNTCRCLSPPNPSLPPPLTIPAPS